MAASSNSRQWQRVLALLQDYLSISKSSVLPKTSSTNTNSTEATIEAIQTYVKQIGVLPNEQEHREIELKNETHHSSSLATGKSQSSAFLPTSKVVTKQVSSLKQSNAKHNSHLRSSSLPSRRPQIKLKDAASRASSPAFVPSIPKVNQIIEQEQKESSTHSTNYQYPVYSIMKINSSKFNNDNNTLTLTETSQASDTVTSPTSNVANDHSSSSSSNHTKPLLTVPSPTYSTMRIPKNPPKTPSSPVQIYAKAVAPPAEVRQGNDFQKALDTVNYYIPQVNLNFLKSNGQKNEPKDVKENAKPKWLQIKKDTISKASIDGRTRHLITGISTDNDNVTLRRLTDLSQHLMTYPQTKGAAVKCGGVRRLLKVLTHTKDYSVAHEARTALSLMGYTAPVKGRGARLLTIDGGGVRGLVAVELIRRLEEKTGKSVFELFDFICGVSTGAIVAVLFGAHRQNPDECVRLYRNLSEKIFTQTAFRGATSLVMNSSYYDSKEWNTILQSNMGNVPLLETANDEQSPKICLVASQAEQSETKAFLFRNYVLPYRVASHYKGTCRAKLWEAVRASAAAPGYFSEFQLGEKVLQDGGILVNNPAAIAVHEARLLWPDTPFQCIVSLGTGRRHSVETINNSNSLNWSVKVKSLINSATDTEGVHTTLHDLLPGNVYFRFNPNLNDDYGLDEIRPQRLARMMDDVSLYIRRNDEKFSEVAQALLKEKTPYNKAEDYFKRAQILHGFKN